MAIIRIITIEFTAKTMTKDGKGQRLQKEQVGSGTIRIIRRKKTIERLYKSGIEKWRSKNGG